jgi:hypothetical protein
MRYLRAVYQLANTLKEHLCKRTCSLQLPLARRCTKQHHSALCQPITPYIMALAAFDCLAKHLPARQPEPHHTHLCVHRLSPRRRDFAL